MGQVNGLELGRQVGKDFPAVGGNGSADSSDYEQWFQKAGRVGAKKMLEVILKRGKLKRGQLQTLSGVSRATFFRGLSWMKRNHLVEVVGRTANDDVILKPLS